MEIYYIEHLESINEWGCAHYTKISPVFSNKENAIKWAEEKHYKLSTECYSDYIITCETVK